MMSTPLAEMARVPEQVAEWAAWSAYESTGRREIKRPRRRRARIRHPRLWDWPRIVMFTLLPSSWFLAVLRWA